MCVCVHAHACVCMRVCVHACVCACVCVYMCVMDITILLQTNPQQFIGKHTILLHCRCLPSPGNTLDWSSNSSVGRTILQDYTGTSHAICILTCYVILVLGLGCLVFLYIALTQVCSLAAAELHMCIALTNHQLTQLSTNITEICSICQIYA